MDTTLSAFLIQARTRRRLTQLELANISQTVKNTISNVERGTHTNLTRRTATAIGMALHEVQPFTDSEMVQFCTLTGVPMHTFAETPQLTDRDRERRQVLPYVDSLLSRYTPESVLFFLQSIDTLTRALIPKTKQEEPREFTHVSAPKYRADLNATEQTFTRYAAATPAKAKPKAKPRRA
jgi:transcriptional regulator with XRE-family HTH domain